MKSDLDYLMAERELAAIIIAVDENYSPPMDYLVGSIHITAGLIMKKQGGAPVIFANPMEIEEAAATGHTVLSFNELGWLDLVKEAEGDRVQAEIVFWGRCLEHIGVTAGKIGIYGVSDLNIIIEMVRRLDAAYPQYQFVGDVGTTLFDEAAITKDTDELARILSVAARTNAVLQATWDFISQHQAEGETVIKPDGAPLTIGDVKRFVRQALMERDLEDTAMIFAQGRDAGFPHSRGQAEMPLKLGQSIVFDLFPREMGGGYHHDTTRTWCIGYAPPAVEQAYAAVMNAFDIAIEAYAPGKPTHLMQEAVQDYFEGQGHPTARSAPGTMQGYVHSLGHGVGLKIHESPRISHMSKEDTFQPGNFITIEPGLYYPDEGYGVRVEDSFYITEEGELFPLTDFRKDLVLPLRG